MFVFSINVHSHCFIPLPAKGVELAEWIIYGVGNIVTLKGET